MTTALKEQFQRHCFIKVGNESTQPLLVPFVKQFYTSRSNRKWYEDLKATQQDALSGDKIDELIAAQEQELANSAGFVAGIEAIPVDAVESAKKQGIRKTKLGPLDKV